MFPEAFRQRIRIQKYINADDLLRALADPSPVTIHINSRKWNRKPLDSDPVPWCSEGFYLTERPSFTLDPLFHAGCYYPREASGMFLEQVYKQTAGGEKGLRILDLCGAPGGKATHLATLIGDSGYLVANEVIRSRASVLAENLTKWGMSNSIVTQNDPSAFSRLPGFFDMILADAPCSGEGMFRDQIAVNEWSENNAILCSERQKRILTDVWPALKKDGLLIYSTCTFNPEENEKNMKWLAAKMEAETVRLDISDYKGITEISHEAIFGYGFYPDKIRGEGLFISVLRKTGDTERITHIRDKEKIHVPDKNAAGIVSELSHFSHDSIINVNDGLISIPCSISDYSLLSGSLKIVKPGTKICSLKKRNYIPSHELAMSVKMRKSVYHTLNLGIDEALSFLRKESISPDGSPDGWLMACFNGVNLGFLNNIGNRMNNYYPVEWRIRMNINDKGERNILNWMNTGNK